ncbi:MAG: response regulator [Candidatus Lokiarchaeota archaeon]|nr:response regulator [Candidatus Lokiarchaeota archaeon]MBD3201646.1 response regulator [Candidatus Lokiarchaeota archaeon]
MVSIFIVEDDESLCNLYRKALELNGYEIIGAAKDGEEAINKFKEFESKPDIIILDHRMPIKNGLEAAKEILQIDKTTKIIFASADKSIKDEAMAIGAVSFKDKPFTLERLFRNIKKALDIQTISS